MWRIWLCNPGAQWLNMDITFASQILLIERWLFVCLQHKVHAVSEAYIYIYIYSYFFIFPFETFPFIYSVMARGSGLPSAVLGVHIPITCGSAMVKKRICESSPFCFKWKMWNSNNCKSRVGWQWKGLILREEINHNFLLLCSVLLILLVSGCEDGHVSAAHNWPWQQPMEAIITLA